jgi:AAA ATPase-like protein
MRPREALLTRAWPLVGRDAEVAVCLEHLGRAQSSGVVLAGAMGVGKTRLAAELAAQCRAAGSSVEWASATAEGVAICLGAFAHLLSEGGRCPGRPGSG